MVEHPPEHEKRLRSEQLHVDMPLVRVADVMLGVGSRAAQASPCRDHHPRADSATRRWRPASRSRTRSRRPAGARDCAGRRPFCRCTPRPAFQRSTRGVKRASAPVPWRGSRGRALCFIEASWCRRRPRLVRLRGARRRATGTSRSEPVPNDCRRCGHRVAAGRGSCPHRSQGPGRPGIAHGNRADETIHDQLGFRWCRPDAPLGVYSTPPAGGFASADRDGFGALARRIGDDLERSGRTGDAEARRDRLVRVTRWNGPLPNFGARFAATCGREWVMLRRGGVA